MANDEVVTEAISPITVVQTGRVQEVPYEVGMTIAAALRALNLRVGRGQEIRLNNQPIRDQDTTLAPADQLMVVGNVAGG